MFPISMTLNITNADQLAAITAAVGGKLVVAAVDCKTTAKADTAKKSDAATSSAGTTTTAAATGVQESKASNSAPADPVAILSTDDLTAAVKNAIAKAGRDTVVALIKKYGAAKAGEVVTEKRPDFDAELLALVA